MKKKIIIISIVVLLVIGIGISLFFLLSNTNENETDPTSSQTQEQMIENYNETKDKIEQIDSLDDFKKQFPNCTKRTDTENTYEVKNYDILDLNGELVYDNDIITFYSQAFQVKHEEEHTDDIYYYTDEESLNKEVHDIINRIETIMKAENSTLVTVSECMNGGASREASYENIETVLKNFLPTPASGLTDDTVVSVIVTIHTETKPVSIVVQMSGIYNYTLNISY